MLFALLGVKAQQIEEYPTSQRYLFNTYNKNNFRLDSLFPVPPFVSIRTNVFTVPSFNPITDTITNIVAQKYAGRRGTDQVVVYGMALPICFVTTVLLPNTDVGFWGLGAFPDIEMYDSLFSQWPQKLIDFYAGPERYVYLMTRDSAQLDPFVEYQNQNRPVDFFRPLVVDSARIRLGVNMVMGNVFRFPNLANWPTGSGHYYTFDYPTVEVYFDEPITVIDTFWVGATFVPMVNNEFGCLGLIDPSHPGNVYAGCPHTVVSSEINGMNGFIIDYSPILGRDFGHSVPPGIYSLDYDFLDVWGGPFPIIAPPPCMAPHALHVEPLYYDSVVVLWDVPVGVPYCRLEYGPTGFVPGTGVVVDSIVGGEYRIGGLTENTEYDVYVTAWCRYDSCYSTAVDTSFTTPEICNPKIQIRQTQVTDSSVCVSWQLPAGASYSEVFFVKSGADDSTGTLYAPLHPDSAGICSLCVTGLEQGTQYEIRVRVWCPYGSSYSIWHATTVKTIGYYRVTALSSNDEWGTVTGGGMYLYGSYAMLTATPRDSHYQFATWNDGVLYATRMHQVTGDTTFTAVFVCDTCPVTISQVFEPKVRLYPNPATSTVTVRSEEVMTAMAAYNVQGVLVEERRCTGTTEVLDVSDWHPGVYMLTVITAQGKTTCRLVIE